MLNNNGERELAYVASITDIQPIEGADKVELAYVNGWHVLVKKGQFEVGDLCAYFEIDSLLPSDNEAFQFMEKYHYKVKTQKFFKGTVISQGLIIALEDLELADHLGYAEGIKEGVFLTERLGVKYYEPEDNVRKANDKKLIEMKFEKLMSRWQKKHPFISKLKLVYLIKSKHVLAKLKKSTKKKKKSWPAWVSKTDEERCQNMPQLFKEPLNKLRWIATEKIDGTSTTFTMLQAKPKKRELLVCSRNIVFNAPNKKCFYEQTEGNVYLEMSDKYDMNSVLNYILDKHPEYEFITIQGETFGGKIQKRCYGPDHRLAIFNYIYKEKGKAPVRLNPIQMKTEITKINVELNKALSCVPIIDPNFMLPDSCDKLLELAEGSSAIDGEPREGMVFRSEDGVHSFKAVSNSFLTKYHND